MRVEDFDEAYTLKTQLEIRVEALEAGLFRIGRGEFRLAHFALFSGRWTKAPYEEYPDDEPFVF